ncbi:unnamed protein product, partial [Didymodactylos carnosus]
NKRNEEINTNSIKDNLRITLTDVTNESSNDEYESTIKSLTFNNSLQTPSSVSASLLTHGVDVERPYNALPPRSFKNRNPITSHVPVAPPLLGNSSIHNNKSNEPSRLAVSMHQAVQYSNKPIDVQFGDIYWVDGNADESMPEGIEDSVNSIKISAVDEKKLSTSEQIPSVKYNQQTKSSFSFPNTLTAKSDTDLYSNDVTPNFTSINDTINDESNVLSDTQQQLLSSSTTSLSKPQSHNFQSTINSVFNQNKLSEPDLTSTNSVVNNSVHLSDHIKQHPEQSSATSYIQQQSNASNSQKTPTHSTNSSTTTLAHSIRNGNNQQQQYYNNQLFQQQQQQQSQLSLNNGFSSFTNLQTNSPASGSHNPMTHEHYSGVANIIQQQPQMWITQQSRYVKNSQNKNIQQQQAVHHANAYPPQQHFQAPPQPCIYPIVWPCEYNTYFPLEHQPNAYNMVSAIQSPPFHHSAATTKLNQYSQVRPTELIPNNGMLKPSTLPATAAAFTTPDNRNSGNNRHQRYSTPNYSNTNRH